MTLYPELPPGFFFNPDHFFNQPIARDHPVDNNSQVYIDYYESLSPIVYGECTMPYNILSSPELVNVKPFQGNHDYKDPITDRFPSGNGLEIQNGRYTDAEKDKDHHLLVVDLATKRLYETYQLREEGSNWIQEGCALFQCANDQPRPHDIWQASADAAGFPILPGLIRRDEVLRKHIPHALRITIKMTYPGYVAPATHGATWDTSLDPKHLPMGARLRLRLGVRPEDFDEYTAVVIRCLQDYGAYVADNGVNFALTAAAENTGDFPQCFRGYRAPGENDKGTFHLTDKYGYAVRPSDFEVMRLGEVHPLK